MKRILVYNVRCNSNYAILDSFVSILRSNNIQSLKFSTKEIFTTRLEVDNSQMMADWEQTENLYRIHHYPLRD